MVSFSSRWLIETILTEVKAEHDDIIDRDINHLSQVVGGHILCEL